MKEEKRKLSDILNRETRIEEQEYLDYEDSDIDSLLDDDYRFDEDQEIMPADGTDGGEGTWNAEKDLEALEEDEPAKDFSVELEEEIEEIEETEAKKAGLADGKRVEESTDHGMEDAMERKETAGPAMAEDKKSRRREGKVRKEKKEKKPTIKISLAVAAATLAVLSVAGAVFYIWMGNRYQNVFFPNTVINGVDASGKTVKEVQQMIAAGVQGYTLTLEERGGATEQITEKEIGLHTAFDGSLEQILAAQDANQWIKYYFSDSSHQVETIIAYDPAALDQVIDGLSALDESRAEKPENAYLSEYVSGQGYSIVPSKPGNQLDREAVKATVEQAILNLNEHVSLEEAGCYVKPEIGEDSEALRVLLEAVNQYVKVTVTYKFGDRTEILSGDTIHKWLEISGTQVSVDEGAVATYVKELAEKYNTFNKAKTLKTSYGSTIKVTGGTYGWKINQPEETKELLQIIRSGQSQTREPVYSQRAASHGDNDYGDTYVEINLTAQHLFFYKDGSLLVESDFVSGNLAKNYGTPAGTYPLTYKQRDAVLKGEDYRTPVSYWMPFNGGIGMHDANWRSSFGGTIYKTGGSHGCVNLPPAVAKKIYESISSGDPVICYNLEGTEKKTTSNGSGIQSETQAPTAPAATAPAESAPVETNPAATAPTESIPAAVTPAQTTPAATQPAGPIPVVPESTAPAPPIAGGGSGNSPSGPGGSPSPGSGNQNYGPGQDQPESKNVGPGM